MKFVEMIRSEHIYAIPGTVLGLPDEGADRLFQRGSAKEVPAPIETKKEEKARLKAEKSSA